MKKNLIKGLTVSLLGLALVACGGTSVATSTSNTTTSETPSSETSSTVENTFGEGITDDEKVILAKITSGDFTKATFEAAGSLKARFDVKVNDKLTVFVYKGLAEAGAFASFDVYVGVNVETSKIVGIEYDGELTSHGKDDEFAGNDLGLVGTEGESSEVVSGASVTSNAIKTVAKAAVEQAKKDAQ